MSTKNRIYKLCDTELSCNKLVTLNHHMLNKVARSITPEQGPDWDFYLPAALRMDAPLEAHQSNMDRLLDVAWFFWLQGSQNYCYWHRDGMSGAMSHWEYGGKKGSSGLVVMTQELFNEGHLFTYTPEALEAFKAKTSDMPLFRTRVRNLLVMHFVGRERFEELLLTARRADGSWHFTADTAQALADAFAPAYSDPLLKRAQLALGLMAANFKARGEAVTLDLTAYADYRLPQVLRHLGVLEYAPELDQRVRKQQLLKEGSDGEKAIRAATVIACKLLAEKTGMSEPEMDAWLFLQSRDADFQTNAQPFHLTPTTSY